MTVFRPGLVAAFLAAYGLASCDDAYTVTRVMTMGTFSRTDLVTLSAGGLPTEIHGAAFAGLAPGEVAARLRLPQRYPAEIRFRAIEPAGAARDRGRRLVLVFNRNGSPNQAADCRAAGPLPTGSPTGEGFTATATFCWGEEWKATGHVEAKNTRADDPDAFTRVMRLFFGQIVP